MNTAAVVLKAVKDTDAETLAAHADWIEAFKIIRWVSEVSEGLRLTGEGRIAYREMVDRLGHISAAQSGGSAQMPAGVERRRAVRVPVAWAARISNAEAAFEAECMIVDISATGARISFQGAGQLPKRLELFVARSNSLFGATVVWQLGRDAGLDFDERQSAESIG